MTHRLLAAAAATLVVALGLASDAAASRVYVGDASTSLYAFDRNDATGALTPLSDSPFGSANTQNGVIASADGSRVYSTGYGSGTAAGFAAPPAGGTALGSLSGSPFATGAHPTIPALTVDGRFLYVPLGFPDDGQLAGFGVDQGSGALTPLPGFPIAAGLGPWKAAVHPGGGFLAVTLNGDSPSSPGFVGIYRIDQLGGLTEVAGSPVTAGIAPAGLVFSHDGRFLFVGNDEGSNISVFSFDNSGGTLTEVSGSPFPGLSGNVSDIDITPDDRFLYAANNDEVGSENGITAFSVSSTTGALTPLTPAVYSTPPFPDEIKIAPDGKALYMTSANDLRGYAIAGDGSLTEVPGSPFPVSPTQALGLTVAPTPPTPTPAPTPAKPSSTSSSGSTTTTSTPPLVPSAGGNATLASGPLRLVGNRTLTARDRRVKLRIHCGPDPAGTTCTGTLRLRARIGRKLRTVGHKTVDLNAGKTGTDTLRLTTAAWHELKHHRLRASLLLSAADRPTASSRVRIQRVRG